MHKQLLYVVKKTDILNKENHNNEVCTKTETNMGVAASFIISKFTHPTGKV